jgi:DNA-binding NarL/FixJ family response regulator
MKGFNILILEDEVVTSVALTKAIHTELPDAHAFRAASLFEGRLFLASFDLQFFIIDILLPDGNGIDFIRDVTARNPAAGVVIITAEPLPKHRDRASSVGALYFLEKPVAARLLGQVIRSHHSALCAAAPGSETSFSASLSRLNVLDVIQLKCLARATLRLDFTLKDGRFGSVYFQDGQIVHAEATRAAAAVPLTGMPALTEILSWRGGTIQEVRDLELPKPTLGGDWQGMLLQAAQLQDERDA